MPRNFIVYYCRQYVVLKPDPPITTPALPRVRGFFYLGIRHQAEYMEGNGLYTKLGFFKKEEIANLNEGVTTLLDYKFNNVLRLGILGEMRFTLANGPPSAPREDEPFRISGTVPYDANKSTSEISSILYAHTFQLVSRGDLEYHVVANTVKPVRRKNNNPTFSGSTGSVQPPSATLVPNPRNPTPPRAISPSGKRTDQT